ncbi:hypothetical protein COCON_G00026330 [Conger conger]|uniref:GATA-type domain-containing protein n=1 Tax=Conger conger TaxID=82655 RepID=A0A9Q1I6S1_CONCO|nr:hypothetical protein COCON_G00026330 [Conger conger]
MNRCRKNERRLKDPSCPHPGEQRDPQHSFEGHSSLLPTEPGSSPWEVMSLINLQCERLLHPENGEEGEAERLAAAPVFEDKPSATGDSKSRHNTNILGSVVRQESVLPESSFSANTDELDVQSQSGPQATSDNSNCESVAQNTVSQEGSLALLSKSHDSYVGNVDEEQLKLKTNHPASDVRWQARRPRKQSHPTRSADLCDPNFKGVTFRMRTELNDNRDQCRLLITSNYSAELLKSIRRARGSRPRSFANSLKTSSSEEDSDSSSLCKNKMCASCNTKKTPLWRDAEDGTPLCNACGIRYKKYRVRCFQCWHIPRKEGNSDSKCCRCGDVLRLVTSQRRLTAW